MFQELLRRTFDYDAITGNLVNKRKRGSRGKGKGSQAGSMTTRGYFYLSAFGRTYGLHRLIYAWHHGDFDNALLVDHINGNPSDNHIENLRLVTETDNHRNRRLGTNNKHGVNCVYPDRSRKKWYAGIYEQGKYIYLGTFETFELAKAARKEAEQKLGYHPNHGQLPKATVTPLKRAS